jgi:hypothetical protein
LPPGYLLVAPSALWDFPPGTFWSRLRRCAISPSQTPSYGAAGAAAAERLQNFLHRTSRSY